MGRLRRPGVVVAVALVVLLEAPPAQAAGAWSATGDMATPRGAHTATLLPGGKVVVVGGRSLDPAALASAEIYDPVTGAWSRTGGMAVGRSLHTATSLPGGKVLVAGGEGPSGRLASAEVYDPATSAWSMTGAMAVARLRHAATSLPDGRVLVVGGEGPSGALLSAEIYDPATGAWSATGSTSEARVQPTLTLLPDGTALVVGGAGELAGAEVYDPGTGAWARTGSMTFGRYFQTATLLRDGRVLAAGGYIDAATTERYDPVARGWTRTGDMTSSRFSGHTATLLPSGNVLVAGGTDPRRHLATAEVYDPATGGWAPTASMSVGRAFHTATLLPNGSALVAGGDGLASAELYTVDRLPPVTGATVAPRPNAAGWNRNPVTVTLTAADEGGGVRELTYQATGAQAIATTTVPRSHATVTLAAEGVTTLSWFARDEAGNVEATRTLVVRIDRTPPSLTVADIRVPATTPRGAVVPAYAVSATNALDPSPALACRPRAPHRFPIGASTVACRAIDRAGNTRAAASVSRWPARSSSSPACARS